jgi:YggT family protein
MNGARAFSYLITTLIDLYIMAVLLRLLLQWARADFYNPLCQFLVQITNPLLVPLRRMIPSIGRLDTASVVLMLALEVVSVWVLTQISATGLEWSVILLFSVRKLLTTLLWTWFFLVIVAVILSWIGTRWRHPVVPLVFQLTDPLLRPFRRVIPPIAGVDLSPMFVLIVLRFLVLLLGW